MDGGTGSPVVPGAHEGGAAGVRAASAAWDAFFVRLKPGLVRDARRLGALEAARDDLVCATISAALEQLADPEDVLCGALAG